MIQAPASFSGTWDEFYAKYIEPNLPAVEQVTRVHEWIERYCAEPDATYIARHVTGSERGEKHVTMDGTRWIAADNSPAWALHAELLEGRITSYEAFRNRVPELPAHFFHVSRSHPANANAAGWYVAHIFPAKDGDTEWRRWTRENIQRRFVRAIHPCNIFLVPKSRGRELGEDQRVIDYFAAKQAARYAAIWPSFLRLASDIGWESVSWAPPEILSPSPAQAALHGYTATRLLFKKEVIERLAPDEAFDIITPLGTFRMTRAQFYSDFSNVVATDSYRLKGIYSYSTLPDKALRFKVRS